MNGKKRIEWVDIAKCICIIFVMLSHLGNHNIAPELRSFYSRFYLTGFLFVSGYTYRFSAGFFKHLKKKTRQLLIPWFLFSVGNILLSQILTFRPEKHTDFWWELGKNCLQIRGFDDGIWFVSALFAAYIFFYFFVKRFEASRQKNGENSVKYYVLIAASLFFLHSAYTTFMPKDLFPWKSNALPWHLEYVPYAMYFMFMGYLFRQSFESKFDSVLSGGKLVILICVYLLCVYIPYALKLSVPRAAASITDFAITNLAVITLVGISKSVRPNRYLLFVGQNTLIYFALHGKVLSLWETVFRKTLPFVYTAVYTSHALSAVYSVLFGILVSIVLIIPAMIINRFFPFMMGRPFTKTEPALHNSDSEKHQ